MLSKKLLKEHFTKGRLSKPLGIVIHVGEGTQEIIYETFLNERRSAHYCVSQLGDIWQFVEEKDSAWAQGIVVNPTSRLVLDNPKLNPNDWAISIEHEGFGHTDFTEAQYDTTSKLVAEICERWEIPLDRERIIRHNEIRANKTCPGIANVDKIVQMAKDVTQKKIRLLTWIIEKLRQWIELLTLKLKGRSEPIKTIVHDDPIKDDYEQ